MSFYSTDQPKNLGATWLGEGRCEFLLWAPLAKKVTLILGGLPERSQVMQAQPGGYHHAIASGVGPGSRYWYELDGGSRRADPASRWQPEGIFGPSAVVSPEFPWEDDGWTGLPLSRYVFYELHVGTFTNEGTFDAAIRHVRSLRELGVTAIELMPVAQFPGQAELGI